MCERGRKNGKFKKECGVTRNKKAKQQRQKVEAGRGGKRRGGRCGARRRWVNVGELKEKGEHWSVEEG